MRNSLPDNTTVSFMYHADLFFVVVHGFCLEHTMLRISRYNGDCHLPWPVLLLCVSH
jgi:hypothetical protein